MANGKIIYPSGEVDQVTYAFVQNYDFGHSSGYLETDDNARAYDGTLNSYSGSRKRAFRLNFTRVTQAQFDALMLAWFFGGKIDFYADADDAAPVVVKMMAPPAGESQAAFAGNDYTWSFEVNFEEV